MVTDLYQQMSLAIEYIEEHLEEKMEARDVAQKVGLSQESFRNFFLLLTQHSFSEYLRKRRLTLAGRDLLQSDRRVIDLAIKYQYSSAAAFSRAFAKFHGILPSEVRRSPQRLCFFPKTVLRMPVASKTVRNYEIVDFGELELRGFYTDTDNAHIHDDAPELFRKIANDYPELSHPDYGLVHYLSGRTSLYDYRYWVLWETNKIKGEVECRLRKMQVRESHFLKFRIASQKAEEIQASAHYFYEQFWPSCTYRFASRIELEHYHDGVTDFLVPIVI